MSSVPPRRRHPTAQEARALGHPLRLEILRVLATRELTNRQLADELSATPGTVLHHIRTLLRVGLVEAAGVRTGPSGALEKPYRATGASWWLEDPLSDAADDVRLQPVRRLARDLLDTPAEALPTWAGFTLHLTAGQVAQLDRDLLAVLDRWVATDAERREAGAPAHRGMVAIRREPT